MENILLDSKFGEMFLTRDDREACVVVFDNTSPHPYSKTHPYGVIVKGFCDIELYDKDGRTSNNPNIELPTDLVKKIGHKRMVVDWSYKGNITTFKAEAITETKKEEVKEVSFWSKILTYFKRK